MLTAVPWLLAGAGLTLSGGGQRRGGAHALAAERASVPPAVAGLLAGVVGAAATVWTGFGLPLGAASALTCATAVHAIGSARSQRRDAARCRSLVVAIRLIAAEFEAGSRPAAALRAGASVCPASAAALLAAAQSAESGGDASPALGTTDLESFGHAWRVAMATGAPATDVLSRVADDLDAQIDRQRQVAAVTAGPRASAALLAVLPAFGLVLGAAMGARPLQLLLHGSGGRALLAFGLILDAAGLMWTRRLISRAARP